MEEHVMHMGKQFRHCLDTFGHSIHRWNTLDLGLVLLAIGFLFMMAGEMLSVHINLIVGRVTCWCGLLCIYLAVAVLMAVLKVQLDDAFGTEDF
jgi:hypothetical protein